MNAAECGALRRGVPQAPMRFGSDDEPGIRRRGTTRFTYVDERSGTRPSADDLARIRSLAVPPAWTEVWISADPESHVQATGRDARHRKQYRYHPEFTSQQASNKFAELPAFAGALGRLRRKVDRDLTRRALDRDRVLATVVRLIDVTSLRIGNDEYARTNGSYGLTTLQDRHAVIRGSTIHFAFRGKSAHDFDVTVQDRRLARIVRACQDLPGQQLFQFEAVDGLGSIGSSDVNAYLSEHGLVGATAKTFRTWNATVLAAIGFAESARAGMAPTNRSINAVVDEVAAELGNTRAVCRASYIHPTLFTSFVDGRIGPSWDQPVGRSPAGLSADERRTLRLITGRARRRVAA
jgi:DNA topoisomerase I